MFQFRTSTEKKIQAAALLVRLEKGRTDRIRLLKLLYIADRESLHETGKPIIGGNVVAMDNGPLHSEMYDLIKGTHEDEQKWSEFFENEGYFILLKEDPGRLDLSPYEVEKLTAVSNRYASQDSWSVADETHRFPEYRECYEAGTSRPIPLEKLLRTLDFTNEEVEQLLQEARAHSHLLSAFEK